MEAFKISFISNIPKDVKYISDNLNCFISGGSIVNHYLGNIINDWDVYVDDRYALITVKYLISKGYILSRPSGSGYSYLQEIYNVLTLKKENVQIDLVVCTDFPLEVINNFDISCCKNFYHDGKLHLPHFWDLVNKKTYVNPFISFASPQVITCHYHSRIEKYMKLGFEIIPALTLRFESDNDYDTDRIALGSDLEKIINYYNNRKNHKVYVRKSDLMFLQAIDKL